MIRSLLLIVIIYFINVLYLSNAQYYRCSNDISTDGEPIQIMDFVFNETTQENQIQLNKHGLESILLRPEIADKQLVILNIAGVLRSGKSFFLNLLLQYLENNGPLDHNKVNLDHGFLFRGGSKRATVGMLMWSQPYCVMSTTGKEVAILLIDTQGTFDMQQTFGDSTVSFALSFLTSSIQIYNLKHLINVNNLQNLEFFTFYGNQISAHNEFDNKPFQKLIFLVRDWPNPEDFEYGKSGGELYLKDIMTPMNNQPNSLQKLWNEIISNFQEVQCFLMPYPSEKVAKGQFLPTDINQEFMDNLNEFAEMVFNPKNLVIKQIGGKDITGKVMFEALELYMQYFKANTNSKPKTVKEAFCEIHNTLSLGEVKLFYVNQMSQKCSDELLSFDPKELQDFYTSIRNQTFESFIENKKLKCDESHKQHLKALQEFTQKYFDNCFLANYEKKVNESLYREKICFDLKEKSEQNEQNLKLNLENINKDLQNTKNSLSSKTTEYYLTNERLINANKQIDRFENTIKTCNNENKNTKNQLLTKSSDYYKCSLELSNSLKQIKRHEEQYKSCSDERITFKTQKDRCNNELRSTKSGLSSTQSSLYSCKEKVSCKNAFGWVPLVGYAC